MDSKRCSFIVFVQLTAIDFNSGTDLKQTATCKGDERFRITASKITKTWSTKTIIEKKIDIFRQMIYRAVKAVWENEYFPVPEIPDLSDYIDDTPKLSRGLFCYLTLTILSKQKLC